MKKSARTRITLGKRDGDLDEKLIRFAFKHYGGNVNCAGRELIRIGMDRVNQVGLSELAARKAHSEVNK